jgi:hypothetical protein
MTLILELTPEQEAKLAEHVRATGGTPAECVARMIDEAPPPAPKALLPGETLLDALSRVGFANASELDSRADGRPWSEVEGFD